MLTRKSSTKGLQCLHSGFVAEVLSLNTASFHLNRQNVFLCFSLFSAKVQGSTITILVDVAHSIFIIPDTPIFHSIKPIIIISWCGKKMHCCWCISAEVSPHISDLETLIHFKIKKFTWCWEAWEILFEFVWQRPVHLYSRVHVLSSYSKDTIYQSEFCIPQITTVTPTSQLAQHCLHI